MKKKINSLNLVELEIIVDLINYMYKNKKSRDEIIVALNELYQPDKYINIIENVHQSITNHYKLSRVKK